jgi:hypothetical protein
MAYGSISADTLTSSTGQVFSPASSIMRNRIINGAMVIDQRNAGASVTPASGVYTLDRWQYGASQASKVTIQQNASSVTPPAGFKNYLGAVVAATATVGAGDYFQFSQKIEANNTSDLDWGLSTGKTVTLSFWAMCSGAVTLSGSIQSTLSPYTSYPFTFAFTAFGTWQQFAITIPAPSAGTNWATGTSASLYVQWNLACGSTYSGTANTWVNNNYFGATGAASLMGTVGNYLYITGVQLEAGSVASQFEYRQYGTELALCQRYYYKVSGFTNSQNLPFTGFADSTTSAILGIPFPVSMRSAPSSLEQSGTATDYAIRSSGVTVTNCSSVPVFSTGMLNGSVITLTVASGLTAGQSLIARTNSSTGTNAYFAWSAEL